MITVFKEKKEDRMKILKYLIYSGANPNKVMGTHKTVCETLKELEEYPDEYRLLCNSS